MNNTKLEPMIAVVLAGALLAEELCCPGHSVHNEVEIHAERLLEGPGIYVLSGVSPFDWNSPGAERIPARIPELDVYSIGSVVASEGEGRMG